jgi:hypothetical protein
LIREADRAIDHGSFVCVNGLIGVPRRTEYHCRMTCRKGGHEQFIVSSHLCLLPSGLVASYFVRAAWAIHLFLY